jgi:hypothetical protein
MVLTAALPKQDGKVVAVLRQRAAKVVLRAVLVVKMVRYTKVAMEQHSNQQR